MAIARFIKNVPHLPVRNLQETINYYINTLSFTNSWTFGLHDGGVSRDDMKLLFAEDPAFTANTNSSSHRLPLIWFVENIESVYAEFLIKKIPIADPLRTHPHELKEFAFIDINGYYVRVAENSK